MICNSADFIEPFYHYGIGSDDTQLVEKSSFLVYFDGIARSSNGRTTDSESVYLGSSPSLAAKIAVAIFAARSKSAGHFYDLDSKSRSAGTHSAEWVARLGARPVCRDGGILSRGETVWQPT